MARTEDGLRNGSRSFRGVYRVSTPLPGTAGLEDIEISDGSDEMKLVVVTPEARRDCEVERIGGREVYEDLYG